MQPEKPSNKKRINFGRRLIIIAVVALLLVVAIVLILIARPQERSVANYCKVYKEEKSRLSKLPGDTYPSGVFDENLSDAGAFAESFGKLEEVAPDEIRSDVKNLQGIYQRMADDPSQALSASLSGVGTESSVKKWTLEKCPK